MGGDEGSRDVKFGKVVRVYKDLIEDFSTGTLYSSAKMILQAGDAIQGALTSGTV